MLSVDGFADGRNAPRRDAASTAASTKLAASIPNGNHTANAKKALPSGMPMTVLVATSVA